MCNYILLHMLLTGQKACVLLCGYVFGMSLHGDSVSVQDNDGFLHNIYYWAYTTIIGEPD